MKWLNNIINISEKNNPGKCPYCNKENTDYRLVKVNEDYGYGDIWCNSCKKAYHISRVKIKKEKLSNIDTSELKYE